MKREPSPIRSAEAGPARLDIVVAAITPLADAPLVTAPNHHDPLAVHLDRAERRRHLCDIAAKRAGDFNDLSAGARDS
jgi:hypothetical protein